MTKQENRRETARTIGILAGVIVGIGGLIIVLTFVFGGASWITAPFRGEVEKREKTVASGDFRIGSYQRYFELCTAVQNAEASIKALNEEAVSAGELRKAQIATSITALKANRAASVNEYNSLSAQEHKVAFKDANLPAVLGFTDGPTTCSYSA